MCTTCDDCSNWHGGLDEKLTAFEIVDFYDGSLLELARCTNCGRPVILAVLAWSHLNYEKRVYALCNLNEKDENAIRSILLQWERSRISGSGPSDSEFNILVDRILNSARGPFYIVLIDKRERKVLSCKPSPQATLKLVASDDCDSPELLNSWLAFFSAAA